MTVDQRTLLIDLQKQVRYLEDDIREHAAATPDVATALEVEHQAAFKVGRTASGYREWLEVEVTQAAVAWVLGMVFVRFCEDNHIIDDAWIAGPADRLREAGERQTQFLITHPHLNDRDWLLSAFEHLAAFPAAAPLFSRSHNALYRLALSADAAEALIAFWRRRGDDGQIIHDFRDLALSTRFAGDLYQDLSASARKMYALLQTPEFVEEFILDLTLDPAIDTFGLEGLKVIDPTCGSGHFLLGSFDRLLDRWSKASPGMDLRERVQKVLDSIFGVDINPFASAIAKFRLTVAALRASGLTRLKDAPEYRLHIGTGDSLLYGMAQAELYDDGLAGHQYAIEDLDEHPGILARGRYHVVVGNPPYITVKDKALNEAYRAAFQTCAGKYALSVPFAELFFRLAIYEHDRSGHVGQITSNSFMKREFGKKLVEQFLPSQDLTHIIDTSGAYIPGHGTPTVILVGRRRIPRHNTVRAVLGVRGEPAVPASPAQGHVWRSIVKHLSEPGFENDYISVTDMSRDRLRTHPWSLAGGGADGIMRLLEERALTKLNARLDGPIGFASFPGSDDSFVVPRSWVARHRVSADMFRPLVTGEDVRDWRASEVEVALVPYTSEGTLIKPDLGQPVWRHLWAHRRILNSITGFAGRTREETGEPWWSWYRWVQKRYDTPLSITFGEVSTHNHFVLDRGGKVFNRTAPVIKLPEEMTEDQHYGLLSILNSSTVCFWLKQTCFNKGGDPMGSSGARISKSAWEDRFAFNSANVADIPLPAGDVRGLDLLMKNALLQLHDCSAAISERSSVPSRSSLVDARREYVAARAAIVAIQEEMDWVVYRLFGIIDVDLSYHGDDLPPVELGQRAFEIILARKAHAGEAEMVWFARHRMTPTVEIPEQWPADYRELVQRRLDLIGGHPHLKLLERPECKRRWASDPWEVMEKNALRDWLLDRLEDHRLWRGSSGRPTTQSVAQLAGHLASDSDFLSVLELWAGRTVADVTAEIGRLIGDQHVPFLAAQRYKPSGLRKRGDWERTWELQRREDAGEEVGTVPLPPKYTIADFMRPSYWRNRGKLDVPKERFISYPGAERGADPSLVLGWAGWDHAEQAMAAATLALNRMQQDGWQADRLAPLLAGVAELEPWVVQWHSEVDARMGMSPAQAVTATLEQQLVRLGLTRDDLKAWRPGPTTDGRRRTKQEADQ